MKTYYVAGFPYSDELFHFGIKGQKWGIRRYQNPDGTLTAAGRQRYSDAIKFGKIDKKNTERTNKEGQKLIDSDRYLKQKYGSYENVKDENKLIKEARNRGINTSRYEKAFDKKYTDRHINKESFYLNNRIEIGKELARNGKTKADALLDGLADVAMRSIGTGLLYKVTGELGYDAASQVIRYAGAFTIGKAIGKTIVDTWSASDYEKSQMIKHKSKGA